MSLSKEEIIKLANLAKLQLSPEEVKIFKDQLTDILGYIDQLKKLDLADTKISLSGAEEIDHQLRLDMVAESQPDTINQAYELKDNYLVSPGVFKK
jgi:aspartyl-tRNA(Asn)/glutamyl-tRNA(Gln) amidotransferase subunit C